MARRTIVFDDLDGTTPEAKTESFAVGGIAYEIDLSEPNRKRLNGALEEFIAAARKVGRVQVVSGGRTGLPKLSRPSAPVKPPTESNGNGGAPTSGTKAIREWAKANGIEVGDKGRVPAHITERYAAEHTVQPAESSPTPPKVRAPRKAAKKATGSPRGRKSTAPPPEELLNVFGQTKDMAATAEHFGVTVPTMKTWVKKAQDVLDPVS